MASIISKKIKNHTYYYYVESKRINGKPKLINQKYLGNAEKMLEKVLLAENPLGNRVLYSDAAEFGAVMLVYRSAWHVESAFKQMKNPKHLTVRPIFHWTDEKIRIHIFICVLAYRLCTLLIKELSDKGCPSVLTGSLMRWRASKGYKPSLMIQTIRAGWNRLHAEMTWPNRSSDYTS